MNFGFREPTIDDTHYSFGDARLGAAPVNPTGDWTQWLPAYEAQADKYETYGCTVWGSQNQLETFFKFLFGTEPNFSERYNYNLAGINPPGTDPQVVYETIRHNGVIPSEELPMPDTYAEFASPRPMDGKYLADGAKWLQGYAYGHDWVLTGGESQDVRVQRLRAALQFSPIGISVTAWFEDKGVYVDNGLPNNHWCLLYFMDDKYFYVFDSYDHSTKLLPLTHVISYAKRISLVAKDPTAQKLSIFNQILNWVKKILNIQVEILSTPQPPLPVVNATEKLKQICLESVGQDLSPLENELGCAEAMSTILKKIYPDFQATISTSAMFQDFKMDKRFKGTLDIKPWTIIISPTGMGNGTVPHGHVGIIGEANSIYSNDSFDSKWKITHSIGTWVDYYRVKGGYPIFIFSLT